MHDFDDPHRSDDELRPVVDALRAGRPELTRLELDDLQRRVRMRVTRRPNERSATPVKTRLAILGTLVLGFCFSATGAGLAIEGFTGSNDASVSQYGAAPPQSPPTVAPPGSPPTVAPQNDVAGEQESGGGAPSGNDVAGETTGPSAVQPARQVAVAAQSSAGSQLPFTGFAAIPVLLIGVGLLAGGFVLRRRAQSA